MTLTGYLLRRTCVAFVNALRAGPTIAGLRAAVHRQAAARRRQPLQAGRLETDAKAPHPRGPRLRSILGALAVQEAELGREHLAARPLGAAGRALGRDRQRLIERLGHGRVEPLE